MESYFKISFPHENEAIKHELVKFKVQCLKVFCYNGNKSTILFFYLIFRTIPEAIPLILKAIETVNSGLLRLKLQMKCEPFSKLTYLLLFWVWF